MLGSQKHSSVSHRARVVMGGGAVLAPPALLQPGTCTPFAGRPHLLLLQQQQAAVPQQEESLLEAVSQQTGRLLAAPQQPHTWALPPHTWPQGGSAGQ